MNYSDIGINSIVVFPAGRRQNSGNGNGTLITESRLSSIVNSLLDVNGFVITKPGTNLNEVNELEMNLLGRHIQMFGDTGSSISHLLTLDSVESPDANFSAFIGVKIDKTADNEIFYEIDGSNGQTYYNGVTVFCGNTSEFSSTGTPTESYPNFSRFHSNKDNTYNIDLDGTPFTCVKVAKYNNGGWVIQYPEFSKIDYIDGGTI